MARKDKTEEIIDELDRINSAIKDVKNYRSVIEDTMMTMANKIEEINKKLNDNVEAQNINIKGMNDIIQENSKKLERIDTDALKKLGEIDKSISKTIGKIANEIKDIQENNNDIMKSVDDTEALKASFRSFIKIMFEGGKSDVQSSS